VAVAISCQWLTVLWFIDAVKTALANKRAIFYIVCRLLQLDPVRFAPLRYHGADTEDTDPALPESVAQIMKSGMKDMIDRRALDVTHAIIETVALLRLVSSGVVTDGVTLFLPRK